jgi:hypothetical protein
MAKFSIVEAVETLEYNFEPYGEKGVIPEPTATQIQGFRQALADLFGMIPMPEEEQVNSQELVKRVADFLGRDTSEIEGKLLHAVADVCSNNPSYDELQALPYRAQQAFVGWISGTFLLPQLPTLATNA